MLRSPAVNTSTRDETSVVKRSILIAGRKTSVSLEDAFWTGLKQIAAARDMTLSDLVTTIDLKRQHSNLSSGRALEGLNAPA